MATQHDQERIDRELAHTEFYRKRQAAVTACKEAIRRTGEFQMFLRQGHYRRLYDLLDGAEWTLDWVQNVIQMTEEDAR